MIIFISYIAFKFQQIAAPQYFSNPAMESTFTDMFQNDRWQSDEIFAQQRLAGTCPFLIQRVTINGKHHFELLFVRHRATK